MCWNIPGQKKRILAFSDLHFCKESMNRQSGYVLENLRRACREKKVDYIFFLGDLIHSLTVLMDVKVREKLEDFLDDLSCEAPIFIITGNHDVCDYSDGPSHGAVRRAEWYSWLQGVVAKNERIHVLDENFVRGGGIFDDGKIRVLGMSLPDSCYVTVDDNGRASAEVFREYAERILPELTKVDEREYYLLVHTPQFLSEIEIDPRIVVLSGHMHNGLVPPLLDELTRFSHRGVVGPGYRIKHGRLIGYFPFARSARYRPRPDRMWLTVNSCMHLPPVSWLGKLDGIFPACSYVVITGDGKDFGLTGRYFKVK